MGTSRMKVKELISELMAYPDRYEVRFASSRGEMSLLSIYDNDTLPGMPKSPGDNTIVWFDLEIE